MAIPIYYGGIDEVYGDISVDSADKILDKERIKKYYIGIKE